MKGYVETLKSATGHPSPLSFLGSLGEELEDHPEARGKKSFVIGGDYPDSIKFGTVEVWLSRWFDYAVW